MRQPAHAGTRDFLPAADAGKLHVQTPGRGKFFVNLAAHVERALADRRLEVERPRQGITMVRNEWMEERKILACIAQAREVFGNPGVDPGKKIRGPARPKTREPGAFQRHRNARPCAQLGRCRDADRLVPQEVGGVGPGLNERALVIDVAAGGVSRFKGALRSQRQPLGT